MLHISETWWLWIVMPCCFIINSCIIHSLNNASNNLFIGIFSGTIYCSTKFAILTGLNVMSTFQLVDLICKCEAARTSQSLANSAVLFLLLHRNIQSRCHACMLLAGSNLKRLVLVRLLELKEQVQSAEFKIVQPLEQYNQICDQMQDANRNVCRYVLLPNTFLFTAPLVLINYFVCFPVDKVFLVQRLFI